MDSGATLERYAFLGPLYEGFVASEIAEQQINRGGRIQIYYFRDHQRLEVDFAIPRGPEKLFLIEANASITQLPAMAQPLRGLADSIQRYKTRSILVHGRSAPLEAGTAPAPGVSALSLSESLVGLDEWVTESTSAVSSHCHACHGNRQKTRTDTLT